MLYASGQVEPDTDFESGSSAVLDEIIESPDVPSMAYAVIIDGEVAAKDAAGLTRSPGGVPVDTGSRYHIGSNTKAMTAVLAAIAVDRGLLEWDSVVGDVLESVTGTVPESYFSITLSQLLSHSAGVPPAGDPDLWVGYFTDGAESRDQRIEMVKDVMALPLLFEPGSGYTYSNFGYIIAGAMIEEAFGEDWESLIGTEVFEKLGMERSGFGPPARGRASEEPWGHNPEAVDPGSIGADNPPGLGPAGTVYSTIEDLIPYILLWLGEGESRGRRIFSEAAFDELIRPRNSSYALGWLSYEDDAFGRVLSHDGSNTMYYAHFTLMPDGDDAVIILCNSGTPDAVAAVYELREKLVEFYF